MPDEIQRDANGYDYAQGVTSRLARLQKIENESWPAEARHLGDFDPQYHLSVLVRLVFDVDGEDFLHGYATRWTRTHAYIKVDDPRVQNRAVWVKAEDVRRG